MELISRNPTQGIYPASPDYMHAIEVSHASRFLFVSGTMGLDESGHAPKGLNAQLNLVWRNIGRILADANMTMDNIIRLTSYLRDPGYAQANQDARVRALGGRRIPTTAIVAETLTPDWLVEIEVIAAA